MKALANLGLALLSLVVALGVAELVVRVWVGPVPVRNVTRVPATIRRDAGAQGIPYLLRPGSETVHAFGTDPRGYFDAGATLTYRINEQGWRGPAAATQKPPGVFRILGLGDSVTFGTGVRDEDLFLSRLQRGLDAEAPGRFEVWNLGVMGFDTAHEAALLKHEGLPLDPDLVIVTFVTNDAETVVPAAMRRNLGLDVGRPARREASPSLLVEHLRSRLARRDQTRRTLATLRAAYRDDSPGWQKVQAGLRFIAALAERQGFPVVLVLFPMLWELDDYPLADAHAKVAAAGRALGMPVLDLAEVFRGRDGPSLWVHPFDSHPNEVAHALAADALLAFLRERALYSDGPSDGSAAASAPSP